MIAIQRVQTEEIPQVKEVLSYTWTDTYGKFLTQQAIDKVTTVWHSPQALKAQALDPQTYFAIAKDETGKIVGLVTARKNDEETIFMGRLYVHPNYQRQGIGSQLFKAAILAFPGAKRLQLEVEQENEKGLNFYRKQGFKELQKKEESLEGVTLHSIVLEKIL